MNPPAPTAAELQSDTTVAAALEAAWLDSQPASPELRHEEGGWIYMDATTGRLSVRRAPPGVQAAIDLNNPPTHAGLIVVGKFHTHPNPTAEGWVPGPSPSDRRVDERHGVPDLIRADDGVYHSGPERRRGGLRGESGYPA